MSDILLNWLAQEVELPVEEVEKDFANGYLWGQLFSHFNMQPDFDKFENKRSPDAMVSNYTRLQPTFKRLGVTMNTRVANSLMREEAGVAMRLLYSIKQNLGQVNKDLEKYKHSGRLGRELGASVEANRTLLESLHYRTPKQQYEQGGMRFFEETMRGKMTDTTKHLMESMHLRRFSERQYRMEANTAAAIEAERATFTSKRQAFHDSQTANLASGRTEKSKQLDRDAAVHASLLRRKEETEREELRVELALAEAARRRKAEGVQLAAQDVTHGIDTFEINMKRLLKGDDVGDEQLTPATTHSPLEHQARLRAMATSTTKLLEETAGYMGTVQAQRADDLATKREREARRRRMLVEQQAAAAEAQRRAEAEALLQTLARQAGEEQKLAARLWQLGQEKEVMRENRALREQQYAERRAQDWEQTLRRELELHTSMRQQYQAQTEAEMAAWAEAQKDRAAAKSAKHKIMCEGMAWQLVQLAERAAAYREKTGELVPRNEWRRWMAMFVASDPELGDPVVKEEKAGPQLDGPLARAAVADWLACLGEFEREDGQAIAPNSLLGDLVSELELQARPAPQHQPATAIQQLPLKLAVVGAPFSGKTSVAHALAKQHRLRVLDPESLIAAAIEAARAWTATQEAEQAAATAAAAAAGEAPAPVDSEEATEVAAESAAPSPQPSRQAALGIALQAALQAGEALPDAAIVSLVVMAMEETLMWTPPVEVDVSKVPAKGGKATAKPAKGAAVPEEPPKPAQGFVLDGFPRTAAQAALLEQELTGLDLAAEQQVLEQASRLAPPPEAGLPQLQRVLTSGLDAVLVLGLADPEAALKRALGRRLDPSTGRVYHLEFDPPPPSDVGLAGRLQEVSDPSNDAVQIQQRMLAHAYVATDLEAWHKRFSRLRRPIDGSGSVADVMTAAGDAAWGVLRAKAAVESCLAAAEAAQKARVAAERAQEYAELARTHAEGAALELLVAKKAEVQAQALLDGTAAEAAAGEKKKDAKGAKGAPVSPPDPAAVELLKAQSAAKCAEALKACRSAASDAMGYAERASGAAETAAEAVQRARASLGDAEVSATAEVDAKAAAAAAEEAQEAAAQAAQKAQASKEAAEVACREATKYAEATTVEHGAQLELTPPTEAAQEPVEVPAAQQQGVQSVAVPEPLATVFMQEWRALEKNYLDGVAINMSYMVERNELAVERFNRIRTHFKALLAAPDNRSALVAKFQQEFNGIDVDTRKLRETQAELVLRSEELREALWALCDKKMEAAEAEKAKVAANSFVADHSAILAQYYTGLAQVEMDRLYATLTFIKGSVPVKYGVLSPGIPSADGAPAVQETLQVSAPDLLSGVVPPELKDKLDEKSKTALPMPAAFAPLSAKSSALATALKLAYAAGNIAIATLLPPPELEPSKKGAAAAKKDAGKKGAAPPPPPADAVAPELAAAIAADVAALAAQEVRILEERLTLLATQAVAAVDGLARLNSSTLDTLSGWIRSRYQAECSAALALDKVIKSAAVAGDKLAAELRLEDDGTMAVVDETAQVVPPHPGFPPPKPVERPPPASVLTIAQLVALTTKLVDLAPAGYLKVAELAEVLLHAGGEGGLPEGWRDIGCTALQGALQLLDPTHSGYADWRQLLACLVGAAFPVIMQATCADMADQCEMLLEGDKDKDGLISQEEWMAVELWFQYRAFQPGSEADLEAAHASDEARVEARKVAFDRATALKRVLWHAFCAPAPEGTPIAGSPRVDVRTLLLYLCADRDLFAGVKKAFSVAANSIASNAKVDATQLHKVAYPMGTQGGQDINLCPMDQEALATVVSTIYASRGGSPDGTPVITAEQLIYGAHGEHIVNHLLGRYQWHDLLIASKMALY